METEKPVSQKWVARQEDDQRYPIVLLHNGPILHHLRKHRFRWVVLFQWGPIDESKKSFPPGELMLSLIHI